MVDIIQEFNTDAYTMLLYGQAGIGKTTFAARADKALIINIENGLKGIDLKASEAFATTPVSTWPEIIETLSKCLKSERFNTVVIDSVTKLQELIIKQVCEDGKKASLADFAYGAGYARFAAEANVLIEIVDALKRNGKNVILIAHEQIETFADPETDSYDRFNISLDKRIAERVKAAVDHVWYMHHEKTVSEKTSGRNSARHRGRILVQTTATGSVVAKTRGNYEQYIEVKNDESASGIWRSL